MHLCVWESLVDCSISPYRPLIHSHASVYVNMHACSHCSACFIYAFVCVLIKFLMLSFHRNLSAYEYKKKLTTAFLRNISSISTHSSFYINSSPFSFYRKLSVQKYTTMFTGSLKTFPRVSMTPTPTHPRPTSSSFTLLKYL